MPRMVVKLGAGVKSKLRRMRKETKDKQLAIRCQIVLLAGRGKTQNVIAEAVGCSVSCVSKVIGRFREYGIPGLMDRREDNGTVKIDEHYLGLLYKVVDGSPQDYGYARPTWTRELLVLVMEDLAGIQVHVTTMSRALAKIGARHGRPKPTVGCPWKTRRRQRRLAELQRLISNLRVDEVAFYVDEVDIHLNPKIGPDWMNRGKQKHVLRPGQNKKCYLAGALNVHTEKLTWVGGDRKTSALFIDLLHEVVKTSHKVKRIHLILDNYKIHKSRQVQHALEELGGRVILHFLPPYCPDENRIERVWKDLHDNVTRNHRCQNMDELIDRVLQYLHDRNKHGPQPFSRKAA